MPTSGWLRMKDLLVPHSIEGEKSQLTLLRRGRKGEAGRGGPGTRSCRQDIWLVVRVPVLSEQMTVVHPRVSTDGSFLQPIM